MFKSLGDDIDLENFILDSLKDKIALLCNDYDKVWNKIFKDLSDSDISVSMKKEMCPVSEKNVEGIVSWIKDLNLKEVYIEYYDKETAKGIESFLKIESSDSKQESVYSYICHN